MKWRLMLYVGIAILAIGIPVRGWPSDGTVERIEKPVREAIEIRQDAQQQDDRWRKEKQKRLALYDDLLQEQAQLDRERERLEREKKALEARVAAKRSQLAQMQQISEQIRPYLDDVMMRLGRFVDDDLPFLVPERQGRIRKLERVLAEPDVTIGEKARKLLEALMVEAEYGQTIEVYRETLTIAGQSVLVDVFRLGRIALFYQGLTGEDCGFYNVAQRTWQPMPDNYASAIRTAAEIGRKTRPAELVSLPVGRLDVP